ncbi:MAG: DUF2284 domain-containing protein [Propionibacterium sp.]|nr:DUF2284 domain-containing protein [Propionibacterium sp.]
MIDQFVQKALDFGFSHAGPMDPRTLEVRTEVRQMCASNLCHAYGRSWSCPPAVGSLAEHRLTIERYSIGLIVQYTAELDDPYDFETMQAADRRQSRLLAGFRRVLWPHFPDLLALGNGPCSICKTCTYPDTPCRFPKLLIESMEAFGLVVSDVCTANGLGYYYGPETITYTGCYLLK